MNANDNLRHLGPHKQAKEWRLIREVPIIPLFEQRQRREVFSPEAEQAIIAEARQPLRDIFVLMMDTGCRPNEILQLRWEHILWDHRLIFISKGKTRKARRHGPLSDRAIECLRRRSEEQGASGYIFPSTRRSAGHYSIGSCDKEFRRVREKLGLPIEAVLYLSRHSFATSLLDATGNIKLVADTLGHAGTDHLNVPAPLNARTQRCNQPPKPQANRNPNDTKCATLDFGEYLWNGDCGG
jgi:integrase